MRGLTYLKENGIGVIGTEAKEKYFWLFPILVPDKECNFNYIIIIYWNKNIKEKIISRYKYKIIKII